MRLPSLQARQQRAARTAPDVLAGRCAAVLISPIPRPSPWICAWRLAVVDLVVALGLQSLELLVLHGYETADLVLAFASLFELRSCRIERHSWCVRTCLERVRTCPTPKTAPSLAIFSGWCRKRKKKPRRRRQERENTQTLVDNPFGVPAGCQRHVGAAERGWHSGQCAGPRGAGAAAGGGVRGSRGTCRLYLPGCSALKVRNLRYYFFY